MLPVVGRQLFQKAIRKIHRLIQGESESSSPLHSYVDRGGLLPAQEWLRLGTEYGGWILPADHGLTANSLCYSAGAGEDISFECALVERYGCHVRIIDPTPRAIQHFNDLRQAAHSGQRFPINNSRVDFYSIAGTHLDQLQLLPVGLADTDADLKFYLPQNPTHVSCSVVNLQKTDRYFTAPCFRLSSIMNRQGDDSIDLLKIDIEGAEYGVIRNITLEGLLPRLLLVEFDETHTPLDNKAPERIRQHVDLLTRSGMRCVAVEGSNATFVSAS